MKIIISVQLKLEIPPVIIFFSLLVTSRHSLFTSSAPPSMHPNSFIRHNTPTPSPGATFNYKYPPPLCSSRRDWLLMGDLYWPEDVMMSAFYQLVAPDSDAPISCLVLGRTPTIIVFLVSKAHNLLEGNRQLCVVELSHRGACTKGRRSSRTCVWQTDRCWKKWTPARRPGLLVRFLPYFHLRAQKLATLLEFSFSRPQESNRV